MPKREHPRLFGYVKPRGRAKVLASMPARARGKKGIKMSKSDDGPAILPGNISAGPSGHKPLMR